MGLKGKLKVAASAPEIPVLSIPKKQLDIVSSGVATGKANEKGKNTAEQVGTAPGLEKDRQGLKNLLKDAKVKNEKEIEGLTKLLSDKDKNRRQETSTLPVEEQGKQRKGRRKSTKTIGQEGTSTLPVEEQGKQRKGRRKSTKTIGQEESKRHESKKRKRKSENSEDVKIKKRKMSRKKSKGKNTNKKSKAGKKKLKAGQGAPAETRLKPASSFASIATVNITPSLLIMKPKEEQNKRSSLDKPDERRKRSSLDKPDERPKRSSLDKPDERPKRSSLDKPEEHKRTSLEKENPKLDLADASVLGITTIKMQEPDEPLPPPPKTRGKNAAKVAKIIHDHLIHKQAVATQNLLRNFRPVQLLLLCCGMFPLQFTKDSEGTWTFKSSLKKPTGIWFLVSSFFVVFTTLVGSMNILFIQQDTAIFPSDHTKRGALERKLGRILLDRHVLIVLIVGLAIIQSFVSVYVLFFRRKKFADHFTDWSDKLLLIQMDMTSGTFLSACVTSLTFIVILVIIFLMSVCFASASTVGGPLCLGMLMLRNFLPYDWLISPALKGLVHAIGLVVMILIFMISKAPLLFFVHKCKLLKNGFAVWNARLYNATLQSTDVQRTQEGRTTYGILYEDYFHLLKLKEDMDKLFAGIVETFLCLQSISITCELYIAIRAMRKGHSQDDAAQEGDYFIRPFDWIPGLLLCIVSTVFINAVSMNAIELGEEIQSGLEIIRRSTMLGKKKEEELFFMASLFTNYTEYNYGTNFLEGLGLFYFDRETHGTIIGLTTAFFMIMCQIQPIMDYSLYQNNAQREEIGRFLVHTEGLSDNHWLPKEK